MTALSSNAILLRKLSIEDAQVFDNIYTRPELSGKINDDTQHTHDDDAEGFTRRMLWLCKFIYTLRLKDKPSEVVGSCVLYNWNKKRKEIYFGGSLLPQYWGKGMMSVAIGHMVEMAKYCLGAEKLNIALKKNNANGIRMAEKLGFTRSETNNDLFIYSRPIRVNPTVSKLDNNQKSWQQIA